MAAGWQLLQDTSFLGQVQSGKGTVVCKVLLTMSVDYSFRSCDIVDFGTAEQYHSVVLYCVV